MRRQAVIGAFAALAGLALAAPGASAQGFGVYEHDACMMGRGGTGVASPCSNAAAIFANPAGMVNANAATPWMASLGVTLIAPAFSYRDSITGLSTDGVSNTIPVPNLYVARQMRPLGGRYPWAIGIGVFAPYGLISEWPETFEGRFLGYRSELASAYIQPTVAVQLNDWLSIGGGFDYIHSSVDLQQRVDLSANATSTPGVTFGDLGIPVGTDFANAQLTGSSWSGTGHFGVLVRTSRFSVGARYQMRATADIRGDAEFTQLPTGILLPAGSPLNPPAPLGHAGFPLDSVFIVANTFGTTLSKQRASVDVPLPDQLVVGVAVWPVQNLTVLADLQWVNWSRFRQLAIDFEKLPDRVLWEDYENTLGFRLGGEYRVNERFTLRAGGLFHQAAAPAQTVTPLLPEQERVEATFGATIRLGDRGRLDVAYQQIWGADRRGRVVEPAVRGPAGAAANTGLYTGAAKLFGANISWGF